MKTVNCTLTENKLVVIVGDVGSSKTSLLHAILNEVHTTQRRISVDGSLSYASQEPWIFPGNIRDNILFGSCFNETRYKNTLQLCCLKNDIRQLQYDDMTILGEQGIALSGGQRARVNLARALYRQSQIYLLDSPLSSLDSRVSRHLFEKCIKRIYQEAFDFW